MFIWPLVIVVFLSNNGKVLAESVKFIKSVGSTQVQEIMKIQVGEMTFRTALSDVNLTSAGKEEIEKLYSECQGKVGSALVECWNSKKQPAQQILQAAEQQNGGPLKSLQRFVENLGNAANLQDIGNGDFAGQVFRSTVLPIIRLILRAVQWAFVNILEAALLLTALFVTSGNGFITIATTRKTNLGLANRIYVVIWSAIGVQHRRWISRCSDCQVRGRVSYRYRLFILFSCVFSRSSRVNSQGWRNCFVQCDRQ